MIVVQLPFESGSISSFSRCRKWFESAKNDLSTPNASTISCSSAARLKHLQMEASILVASSMEMQRL